MNILEYSGGFNVIFAYLLTCHVVCTVICKLLTLNICKHTWPYQRSLAYKSVCNIMPVQACKSAQLVHALVVIGYKYEPCSVHVHVTVEWLQNCSKTK